MIKGAPYQCFGLDTIYNGPIIEEHSLVLVKNFQLVYLVYATYFVAVSNVTY